MEPVVGPTEITRQCKECFNYVRPGLISTCCAISGCTYETKSSISAENPNRTCGASFQTLLNQTVATYGKCNSVNNTVVTSTFNSANSATISAQLQSQLINYGVQRNNQFQPVRNVFIPPSVLQLQRETINAGVPKPVNVCRPKPMSLSYNFMG